MQVAPLGQTEKRLAGMQLVNALCKKNTTNFFCAVTKIKMDVIRSARESNAFKAASGPLSARSSTTNESVLLRLTEIGGFSAQGVEGADAMKCC